MAWAKKDRIDRQETDFEEMEAQPGTEEAEGGEGEMLAAATSFAVRLGPESWNMRDGTKAAQPAWAGERREVIDGREGQSRLFACCLFFATKCLIISGARVRSGEREYFYIVCRRHQASWDAAPDSCVVLPKLA